MADPALLNEAVVWWTGWGRMSWPSRQDADVAERYGEDTALDLIPAIKLLEADFYASEARHRAPTLAEMGDRAAEDFRKLHPEVSKDAVKALAWCYTFDYK